LGLGELFFVDLLIFIIVIVVVIFVVVGVFVGLLWGCGCVVVLFVLCFGIDYVFGVGDDVILLWDVLKCSI